MKPEGGPKSPRGEHTPRGLLRFYETFTSASVPCSASRVPRSTERRPNVAKPTENSKVRTL